MAIASKNLNDMNMQLIACHALPVGGSSNNVNSLYSYEILFW